VSVLRGQVEALIAAYNQRVASGKLQFGGETLASTGGASVLSGLDPSSCTVNQYRLEPSKDDVAAAAERARVGAEIVPKVKAELKTCVANRIADGANCADLDAECAAFKGEGFCTDAVYEPFMRLNCTRTCLFCCDPDAENYLNEVLVTAIAEASVAAPLATCLPCPAGDVQPALRHNATSCRPASAALGSASGADSEGDDDVDSVIMIIIVGIALVVLAIGLFVVVRCQPEAEYQHFGKVGGSGAPPPVMNFAFVGAAKGAPDAIYDTAESIPVYSEVDDPSADNKIYAVPMDAPYGDDSYASIDSGVGGTHGGDLYASHEDGYGGDTSYVTVASRGNSAASLAGPVPSEECIYAVPLDDAGSSNYGRRGGPSVRNRDSNGYDHVGLRGGSFAESNL